MALLLAARYRGGRGTRPPERPTGSESPPRCEECGQAQRERSDRQPEAGEHKGRGGAQRGKGARSAYGAYEWRSPRERHPSRASTPSTRRAGLPSRTTRARRRGKPATNSDSLPLAGASKANAAATDAAPSGKGATNGSDRPPQKVRSGGGAKRPRGATNRRRNEWGAPPRGTALSAEQNPFQHSSQSVNFRAPLEGRGGERVKAQTAKKHYLIYRTKFPQRVGKRKSKKLQAYILSYRGKSNLR